MRVSQFIDLAQYAKKTVDEAISAAWSFTNIAISNFTNSQHNHSNAANGGTISHANLTSIGSNSHAQIDTHIAAASAHGVSGSIVGTSDTQILSNKSFTGLTTGKEANFHFPTSMGWFKDDFTGNSNSAGELTWSNQASGTGASVTNAAGTPEHPGVRQALTGTQATGYAGINHRTTFLSPNGGDNFVGIIRLTANTGQILRIGLCDFSTGADANDGYYFEFDTTISPNWRICSSSSSSGVNRTKTTTSVAVAADTWYKLEVKVNDDNTAANYYIDGVLVGTITTNLVMNTTGLSAIIQNDGTSTTSVGLDLDLVYWYNKGLVR